MGTETSDSGPCTVLLCDGLKAIQDSDDLFDPKFASLVANLELVHTNMEKLHDSIQQIRDANGVAALFTTTMRPMLPLVEQTFATIDRLHNMADLFEQSLVFLEGATKALKHALTTKSKLARKLKETFGADHGDRANMLDSARVLTGQIARMLDAPPPTPTSGSSTQPSLPSLPLEPPAPAKQPALFDEEDVPRLEEHSPAAAVPHPETAPSIPSSDDALLRPAKHPKKPASQDLDALLFGEVEGNAEEKGTEAKPPPKVVGIILQAEDESSTDQ